MFLSSFAAMRRLTVVHSDDFTPPPISVNVLLEQDRICLLSFLFSMHHLSSRLNLSPLHLDTLITLLTLVLLVGDHVKGI